MTKMITLKREVDDTIKTPQLRVILKTLEDLAGVDNPYPYLDLVAAVDANPDFKSRQGAVKVVRFYEKAMVENNLALLEGSDKPENAGKPPRKVVGEKSEDKPATERKASRRKKEGAQETAAA